MHGPALALAALEDLQLPGYHLPPATRADLLVRLGRDKEAAAAYDKAIALVGTETERAFLDGAGRCCRVDVQRVGTRVPNGCRQCSRSQDSATTSTCFTSPGRSAALRV